jgi:hypothetical protein
LYPEGAKMISPNLFEFWQIRRLREMSKQEYKQVPYSEAVTLKNGDIAMVDGDRLVPVKKRGAIKKTKTAPATKIRKT